MLALVPAKLAIQTRFRADREQVAGTKESHFIASTKQTQRKMSAITP
jgi:hypothetical protein